MRDDIDHRERRALADPEDCIVDDGFSGTGNLEPALLKYDAVATGDAFEQGVLTVSRMDSLREEFGGVLAAIVNVYKIAVRYRFNEHVDVSIIGSLQRKRDHATSLDSRHLQRVGERCEQRIP